MSPRSHISVLEKVVRLENRKEMANSSLAMTFVEKDNLARELFGSNVIEAQPLAEISNAIDGLYLPNPNDLRPFGFDESVYQDEVDHAIMAAYKAVDVLFDIVRGGQSWGYIDPLYVKKVKSLIENAISAMTYWVVFPGQPVIPQVNKCVSALKLIDWDASPYACKKLWIDLELHHGKSREYVMNQTWEMIRRLQDILGDAWTIGVYSGAWFLQAYGVFQEWVKLVKWWMAHYNLRSAAAERPDPPDLSFIADEDVEIHQTGSFGAAKVFGAKKAWVHRIDTNRIRNMTPAQALVWLGREETLPPPPPPPSKPRVHITYTGDVEVTVERIGP